MSIMIRRLDGPTKGQVYLERDDIAQNLIDVGSAEMASHSDLQRAVGAPMEVPENSSALSEMKVRELKKEAKRRGVKVKGTGMQGGVTKSDLLKALK
jgi:hypothetical protein